MTNGGTYRLSRLKGSPKKALRARDVEEGFIKRQGFDEGREVMEDGHDLSRNSAVKLHPHGQINAMREASVGLRNRLSRMDAKLARFIRTCRNNASSAGARADDDGLPPKLWILSLFDGREEGVHVDV